MDFWLIIEIIFKFYLYLFIAGGILVFLDPPNKHNKKYHKRRRYEVVDGRHVYTQAKDSTEIVVKLCFYMTLIIITIEGFEGIVKFLWNLIWY